MQGAGCRVQGAGCRVQGAGRRAQGAGCRVQGAGCRVQGAGCRVQGAGCRVQGTISLERAHRGHVVHVNPLLCQDLPGSEVGSYSRLIDLVFHSTRGLRVIKKRGRTPSSVRICQKFSI